MYLKQLNIVGFKSFKNEIVLKFPQTKKDRLNMTAIIGPNGVGKSNLIEAISWGLGEQGLKPLRVKKSEDIIFFGSKKKLQSNLAQVTLLFNNEDNSSGEKYKEFSITRKIYRNQDGEYFINKSKVKLQDINLLMAESNFGQKSYSIISQGLTDKIITSSSIEKKYFFDEATGIKKYIYKKDKVLRKINKSKNNLDQAQIALNEIKPHLASLTRQVNKLSKRKEIEGRLFNLQKIYYENSLYKLNNEIKALNEKKEKQEDKKRKLEKELNKHRIESKKLISNEVDAEYKNNQKKYQEIIEQKNKYEELKLKIIIKQNQKQNKTKTKHISIEEKEIIKQIKNIINDQEKLITKINQTTNIKEFKNISSTATNVFEKLTKLLIKITGEDSTEKSHDKSFDEFEKTKKQISEKIFKLNKNAEKINKSLSEFAEKEINKRKKLFDWQKKIQTKQNIINNINNLINEFNVSLARVETTKQVIEKEINQEKLKIDITKNKNNQKSKQTININEINNLKHQIELIGGIDPEVTKEYPSIKERYDFLQTQTSDISESLTVLEKIEQKLNEKIKNKFEKNFSKINETFDKYFKIIFNGGTAKITYTKIKSPKINDTVITTEKEINKDEIEILVNPPGKKIKNIQMLSGGEKALSSLALICAIISINKPPFVILDEADSMLDQENCFKFIKILKELRKYTQFIAITHNQQTIKIADLLYGITMDPKTSISKIISLKLNNSSK